MGLTKVKKCFLYKYSQEWACSNSIYPFGHLQVKHVNKILKYLNTYLSVRLVITK